MCCSSHRGDGLKEHFHCSLVGAGTSFSLTFVFVTVWSESKNKGTSLKCKAVWLTFVFMPILVLEAFPKKGTKLMPVGVVVLSLNSLRSLTISYNLSCYLCVQSISVILDAAWWLSLFVASAVGQICWIFFLLEGEVCLPSLVYKEPPWLLPALSRVSSRSSPPSQGWQFRLCCHTLSAG